jgi:hypothetical protein
MITPGRSGKKAKRTKKEGEEEVLHFSLLNTDFRGTFKRQNHITEVSRF